MTVGRRGGGRSRRVPVVPSPYDATAALERMLRLLRAETGATRVAVLVHEPATGTAVPFRQAVVDTPEGRAVPGLRTAVTLSCSPFLSAVVGTQQPVAARADGRRAADRDLARHGVRSAHGEPLLRDGAVVGVLTVEPAAAAAPHLLRRVGPTLATALVEAWHRHAQARRLAHAEVLVGLIESTARARSTDHLLATACRRLTDLDGVDRACVFLLEDGRPVPRVAAGAGIPRDPDPWIRSGATERGRGLVEEVVRTGRPIAADQDSGLLADCWGDRFQVGSRLAVPLSRGPDLVGVITLDSTRPHPFDDDVRRLATAAGAHVGAVLTAARDDDGVARADPGRPRVVSADHRLVGAP